MSVKKKFGSNNNKTVLLRYPKNKPTQSPFKIRIDFEPDIMDLE